MTEDRFGWQEAPAFMMAKVGKKGIAKWARINLADVPVGHEIKVPLGKLRFEVPENAQDTTLYFGFYELWSGGWKGGLRIHEAVVEKMPDGGSVQINHSCTIVEVKCIWKDFFLVKYSYESKKKNL
jgi:hypothetical protein